MNSKKYFLLVANHTNLFGGTEVLAQDQDLSKVCASARKNCQDWNAKGYANFALVIRAAKTSRDSFATVDDIANANLSDTDSKLANNILNS